MRAFEHFKEIIYVEIKNHHLLTLVLFIFNKQIKIFLKPKISVPPIEVHSTKTLML